MTAMSDLVASWGGRRVGAGRKPGDIGMADRIRRYAVAEKAARYADEIISYYAEVFRNQGEDTVVRMAAGKWLWEAAFGKPGQAVDTTPNQQPKQVLHVRWLPPDPNDRSKVIEPEPD
jgi:hypothetical protein